MTVDAIDVYWCIRLVGEAKTGDAANDALCEGPGKLRLGHRLVVETDGHQRMHLVDHVECVAVNGRPRVLTRDDLTIRGCTLAGADVDFAINGDQAVRAVTRKAVEAARTVILERAGEDADAVSVECRGKRVARLDGDFAPFELNTHAEPS